MFIKIHVYDNKFSHKFTVNISTLNLDNMETLYQHHLLNKNKTKYHLFNIIFDS